MKKPVFVTGALLVSMLACACGDGGTTTTTTGTGGSGGAGVGGSGGTGEGGSGTGAGGTGTATDLAGQIAAIPGVTIVEEGMVQGIPIFMLDFEQLVDHDKPDGATFKQRISLAHRSFEAPTVLATTGYNLYVYQLEPTALVSGNQLIVEHRFFTPSRPEPADWHDLRIRQAAADHHRIVEAFKPLYHGNWLSTGASKGGMTSVYHRRFYPGDVTATIAYVAPQSYGDQDPRYVDFLNQVGDAPCRDALEQFQKTVLLRRPEMTARMVAASGAAAYSHHGLDAALDYAVIELPFTFWQYNDASLCPTIPAPAASDDEVWTFLDKIITPQFWADEAFQTYEPYYFQAAVELGYPAYDTSHLAGMLTVAGGLDVASTQVAPGPTKEMTLDPLAMMDIADWLATDGERMMFVYGENDPYSAAPFELGDAKDSFRFFVAGGNHGASISDLAPADQTAAKKALGAWAGVPVQPVPPEVLARQRDARLKLRESLAFNK